VEKSRPVVPQFCCEHLVYIAVYIRLNGMLATRKSATVSRKYALGVAPHPGVFVSVDSARVKVLSNQHFLQVMMLKGLRSFLIEPLVTIESKRVTEKRTGLETQF